MFRNYLISAYRNFTRQSFYSIINIIGLSLGLTCAIFAFTYIQHELSYDRFHDNPEEIHLVYSRYNLGSTEDKFAVVMPALAPAIKANIPEITEVVRIKADRNSVIKVGDLSFKTDNKFYCDPNFFDFFNFKLLPGFSKEILENPNQAILSESFARKLFGNHDAIGRSIKTFEDDEYTVTGIAEDAPANSQIQYDVLISSSAMSERRLTTWNGLLVHTFVRLVPGADEEIVKSKINAVKVENCGDSWINLTLDMIPMVDVHLAATIGDHIHQSSSIQYVIGFGIIAAFILLLACFNFINLSTARSGRRIKEIGMRKVLGAERSNLIFQFLGESFLYVFVAVILSLGLVEMFLPMFNNLAERNISFSFFSNPWLLPGIVLLTIIVTLVSGAFPALIMSSLKPAKVLRGSETISNRKGGVLRKVLVTGQFCISIALIFATITIFNQIRYMQKKELGFDSEKLVVLSMGGHHGRVAGIETVKSEMEKVAGVESVCISNNYPFRNMGQTTLLDNIKTGDRIETWLWSMDENYLDTYNMKIVEGRNIDKDHKSDASIGVVVNESLVKLLGWEGSPIGKKIDLPRGGHAQLAKDDEREYEVIGVVKDFHLFHFKENIEPVAMLHNENDFRLITLKIQGENFPQTLKNVEKVWYEIVEGKVFEPEFVDAKLNALFKEDRRFAALISMSTIISIAIAVLGLVGLSSYMTSARKREIGIRKVMGASHKDIIALISQSFVKLLLLALVIATPFAWITMQKWLENYAYHVNINIGIILISSIISLLLVIISVGAQAYKAACENPADTLQVE